MQQMVLRIEVGVWARDLAGRRLATGRRRARSSDRRRIRPARVFVFSSPIWQSQLLVHAIAVLHLQALAGSSHVTTVKAVDRREESTLLVQPAASFKRGAGSRQVCCDAAAPTAGSPGPTSGAARRGTWPFGPRVRGRTCAKGKAEAGHRAIRPPPDSACGAVLRRCCLGLAWGCVGLRGMQPPAPLVSPTSSAAPSGCQPQPQYPWPVMRAPTCCVPPPVHTPSWPGLAAWSAQPRRSSGPPQVDGRGGACTIGLAILTGSKLPYSTK
jgi:hypothetical protein